MLDNLTENKEIKVQIEGLPVRNLRPRTRS